MANKDTYTGPFERYATPEMAGLFSPQTKFSTWRRVWLALAEAQHELGLPVTEEQLDEMRTHLDTIDFDVAAAREREVRHDVMAHIHAFGLDCPKAKPILHLGATSCFVGDNTDLIVMRDALQLVRGRLLNVVAKLAEFAKEYRDLPTLGFTHFQPAQLVTVGKRATLWMQDLLLDLDALERVLATVKCRGAKGTTGTQASFLALFDGDHDKVKRLETLVAEKLGFSESFPVTGQTYPRKLDTQVVGVLAGIAESACKFGTDLRLLQNMKEIEEPFEKQQAGSSAMAYKRNPMRAERMCSLARHLLLGPTHARFTSATQWFERTLDDSAIRRIVIPESFLTCDAILNLYLNIVERPVVNKKVILKHIEAELPFMATENIIMECVRRGGDRQELHETIRKHAMAAATRVKEEGAENDLIDRLAKDPAIGLSAKDLSALLDVKRFIGRASEQVDEFLEHCVRPILEKAKRDGLLGKKSQVDV